MNILVITSLFPPLGSSGHDERCRQVVFELSKRGHKVQVLTSNFRARPMGISGEDAIYRKLILEDELIDPTTASFKQILNREQANTGILYRRLRRFKPDAVYIWNMKGLSASLPIICQLLNIPIVYDLHSKWLDPISLRMDPWIHWWTKRSGLKAVFQKFISVITGRRRSYMKWMPLARTERYDLKQSYLCSESLKQELLESGVSAVANLPILYPALNTENH